MADVAEPAPPDNPVTLWCDGGEPRLYLPECRRGCSCRGVWREAARDGRRVLWRWQCDGPHCRFAGAA